MDHATAIGAGSVVSGSNSIEVGRSNGSDTVLVPGKLVVLTLGAAGSTTLCRNGLLLNEIATCSSSLRYKTNLAPYRSGMEVVNRLRPITFDWKQDGMHDLGFGAEEVEKIVPVGDLQRERTGRRGEVRPHQRRPGQRTERTTGAN